MTSAIGDTYAAKSNRPRMDPCGTPDVQCVAGAEYWPILTYCRRFDAHESIYFSATPRTPNSSASTDKHTLLESLWKWRHTKLIRIDNYLKQTHREMEAYYSRWLLLVPVRLSARPPLPLPPPPQPSRSSITSTSDSSNKSNSSADAVQAEANFQKPLNDYFKFWPWKCRSRSKSTTFAMVPFDGKYHNL